MSIFDIQYSVAKLRELRRQVEDLEAEITGIQDSLKAEMNAQGVRELTGLDFKILWKNVESRRFDSKSFKADHADLYRQYSRPIVTTRFILSA